MRRITLWKRIIIAIILGSLFGMFFPSIVPNVKFLGDIFLRLLKMLIAPLVLFSLVSGICKMGDIKQLRNVGLRVVIFYLLSSLIAAILGVSIALITSPGKGVSDLLGVEVGKSVNYNFIENFVSWFPINIFESLSKGNTLQIIIFSLLIGIVLLKLGEKVLGIVKIIDQFSDIMLKLTEIIMEFSPIGIFALIAELMTSLSGNMFKQVFNMILTVYIVLFIVIFILQPFTVKLFTKESGIKFLKNITPAMIVAASTTSSAATLPVSIKCAEEDLGVPENIYGFSLPLGNTCNMNGLAVGLGVISVFASYIYGYPITIYALIQFVMMGLILSVGCAGVKGAGIVMSTVLLQTFGMPLTLIPILAAIWPITDIGYTTANITGDLAGTTVVANSLNMLDKNIFRK